MVIVTSSKTVPFSLVLSGKGCTANRTPKRSVRTRWRTNFHLGCTSKLLRTELCNSSQEWPRQTKPKKGQFMNFSQGHPRTKVQCESSLFLKAKHQNSRKKGQQIHDRPCFLKEKHQNSRKKGGEIHMNFSFWPFLWFGLPGRLL